MFWRSPVDFRFQTDRNITLVFNIFNHTFLNLEVWTLIQFVKLPIYRIIFKVPHTVFPPQSYANPSHTLTFTHIRNVTFHVLISEPSLADSCFPMLRFDYSQRLQKGSDGWVMLAAVVSMPLWALVSLERLLSFRWWGLDCSLHLISNHSTSHVKHFPCSLRGTSRALSVGSHVYRAQEATEKNISDEGFDILVSGTVSHAWHLIASPTQPLFKLKPFC